MADLSRVGKWGDGGAEYSNVLFGTSLLVDRKPLGQRRVAGDDATGKLAVPNPLYTGRGVVDAHTQFEPGSSVLLDYPGQREHFRHWQQVRRGYDTKVQFTQQYRIRTPIALPSIIPVHVPGVTTEAMPPAHLPAHRRY